MNTSTAFLARLLLILTLLGLAADPSSIAHAEDPADPPTTPEKPTVADRHVGPETPPGSAGPARFIAPLLATYNADRAFDHVAFVDRFYREPGNDGYEAVLDRVIETLRTAGFGASDARTLEVVETRETAGWRPVRAALTRLGATDADEEVLLSFDPTRDRDRTMLPTGAKSARVEGRVVFSLDEVEKGTILITGQPLAMAARRAVRGGAVAVLGIRLESYHQDPTGAERHLDTIVYSKVRPDTPLPVGRISMRVHDRLRALVAEGEVRVRWEAEVATTPRPLRTVIATIAGRSEPERVVAIAGHVQEPGAVDNASGVGGLLEAAVTVAAAIDAGTIERPRRSVAFIWGNEMEQSRVYLDHLSRGKPNGFDPADTVLAALSADMIGASRERTGAWPLLERDPDPGALVLLPPDRHTPWGAGRVRKNQLRPNGLSLVARLALRDVARSVGGWETREHPYEGGSDHDIFLRREIPALLFWCFTDFAYHTNLDRLAHVDREVMRRLAVAIVATAFSLADPVDGDLARYREGAALDRELRIGAAKEAGRPEVAAMWEEWFAGVESWLATECAAPVEEGAKGSGAGTDDR